MSPEIGLSQGATLSSDVYSFGVLLYEICTLEKPFKQFKERPAFIQDVFLNNYRPDLTTIISKAIRDLISKCWDENQFKRPNMKTVGNVLRVETALLNVRHQCRKGNSKTSTELRRSDKSMELISTHGPPPSLSVNSFGSIGSLRSSPKRSYNRSSGATNPMGLRSTAHSSVDINSYVKQRSSAMRRMGSENFVWKTGSQSAQKVISNNFNKSFGKAPLGRNSLTLSLFDRRNRRSKRSLLKESLSSDSIGGLNDIKEMKVSSHDSLPARSNRCRLYLGSNLSRLSSDSMSSFGGDSVATDMSASNFTLGELKPRKLGLSKRNAFFPSLSSKALYEKDRNALFTIDIDHGSTFTEHKKRNDSVLSGSCIEADELSSDSSIEIDMQAQNQVEVLTT